MPSNTLTQEMKNKLFEKLEQAKTLEDLDDFIVYIMFVKKFKRNYAFYEMLDIAMAEYNRNNE